MGVLCLEFDGSVGFVHGPLVFSDCLVQEGAARSSAICFPLNRRGTCLEFWDS
jgi:hypothetical protein